MKSPSNKKKSHPNDLVIKNGIQGNGVFASRKINKGTLVFIMHGKIINAPTQTSVQIGEHSHIEDPLAGLINHSCQPSVSVNRLEHAFMSLRDILPDEEITFDYTQNEDHMAVPFKCECCGQKIRGRKVEA
tara:strand:+ start:2376 stop:2768 length:393 start_codon:yes stop_codon:yes gene_type:complete